MSRAWSCAHRTVYLPPPPFPLSQRAPDAVTSTVENILEPWVLEMVAEHKGSISAEHGIGQQKNGYLHLAKSPPVIDLMRAIKGEMDPKGILNPYKVLPNQAS